MLVGCDGWLPRVAAGASTASAAAAVLFFVLKRESYQVAPLHEQSL